MFDAVPISREEIAEKISLEQYEVHRTYAQKLIAYVEPTYAFHGIIGPGLTELLKPPSPPTVFLPPKPRLTFTVCKIASEYACALLDVELKYNQGVLQASEVAITRIEALVTERVMGVGGVHHSISRHATKEEIGTSTRKAMTWFMHSKRANTLLAPIEGRSTTNTIGERLKQLREEAQLTAKELGEQVGLTQRTVYRHEAGSAKIRPTNARKYEEVLSELLKRHISLGNVTLKSQ